MFAAIPRALQLAHQHRALLIRLAAVYGVLLIAFFGVQSSFATSIQETSFVGPKGMSSFPLLLIGALLIGLFLYSIFEDSRKTLGKLSLSQISLGITLVCMATFVAYWATHPTLERFYWMHQFIQKHPIAGGPIMAALLYSAMILPLWAAFVPLFPSTYLWRNWSVFLFGVLLLESYLFSSALEALYYKISVVHTLRISGAILALLPGESMVSAQGFRLGYRGYEVVVGPACSGITMLTLFVGLFGFLWYRFSSVLSHLKTALSLTIGVIVFFILNAMRIVLIMVVGGTFPWAAAELFHGSIGAALFFLLFLVYLKWIFPLLKKS